MRLLQLALACVVVEAWTANRGGATRVRSRSATRLEATPVVALTRELGKNDGLAEALAAAGLSLIHI